MHIILKLSHVASHYVLTEIQGELKGNDERSATIMNVAYYNP